MVKGSGVAAAVLMLFFVTGEGVFGQTTTPSAVVPGGGSGTANGTTLSWTIGQASSATFINDSMAVTAGVQQPEGVELALNIAVLLEGPYDAVTDLMHDSLRTRGLLPHSAPYSGLGLPNVGLQGGSSLSPAALLVIGPDAVVDWVFIELRGADDATRIDAARSALVQRDGDVVDADGVSPVRITALPGSYRLAILHRNHLPVMSQAPVMLGTGTNTFDLTDGGLILHVPDALAQHNGRYLLWQGDVTHDAALKYTGSNNDRDPILVAIGGTVPTNTISGYLPTDVNMDGTVKYTGARNDRDPILVNIGGTVPTNVRSQPLP